MAQNTLKLVPKRFLTRLPAKTFEGPTPIFLLDGNQLLQRGGTPRVHLLTKTGERIPREDGTDAQKH